MTRVFFRFVPTSSATLPIDWTKIPDASKEYFLHYFCHDWLAGIQKPFPATLGDLAKVFDECKFFGYMGSDFINLLLGLKIVARAALWLSDYPGFYMKYVSSVWFIIFTLGVRDSISGHSPILPWRDDYDDEKKRKG